MKNNILYPLLLAATTALVAIIFSVLNLDFEKTISMLQIEHYILFAYCIAATALISLAIFKWSHNKIKKELKDTKKKMMTYKAELDKYKAEDDEVKNIRAVIRYNKEQGPMKA